MTERLSPSEEELTRASLAIIEAYRQIESLRNQVWALDKALMEANHTSDMHLRWFQQATAANEFGQLAIKSLWLKEDACEPSKSGAPAIEFVMNYSGNTDTSVKEAFRKAHKMMLESLP